MHKFLVGIAIFCLAIAACGDGSADRAAERQTGSGGGEAAHDRAGGSPGDRTGRPSSDRAGGSSVDQAIDDEGSGYHAPAGAVTGSYEDWCGAHGVPESACTRCDPSLIPAFKATHDWCDEHGLPESQCKACNPDLVIARPPKPEAR